MAWDDGDKTDNKFLRGGRVMKYKLMYVLLLFFLILLIVGGAVYSKEVDFARTKNETNHKSEKNLTKSNNNEEMKIEDKTSKDNTARNEVVENMIEETKKGVLIGDINNDGKISITDLSLLNKHIIGINEIEKSKRDFADIDGDGKISITDLSKLNQIILKN